MKLQNAASYILTLSAAWIALSFAYVFGALFRSSPAMIGLLRLDEIIVSSSTKLLILIAIGMPLLYAVSHFVIVTIDDSHSRKPGYTALSLVGLISCLCITLYLYIITEQIWFIRPEWGIAVLCFAAALPLMSGVYFDRFYRDFRGRAVSVFIAMAVLAFGTGSSPRNAFGVSCVTVSKGNAIVVSGRLTLAAPSGVFVSEPKTSKINFLPSTSFNKIEAAQCRELNK